MTASASSLAQLTGAQPGAGQHLDDESIAGDPMQARAAAISLAAA